ncbi:MAG: histidine kinase [Pontiella sp.]
MRRGILVLYTLAWLAYVVFTFNMFPHWKINVAIPVIALVGLGGWILGITKGLILIIPAMIYHYLLLSEIYAHILIYYEGGFVGTFMCIVVVFLTGTLRNNFDAIKNTNIRLDQLVDERNAELRALASNLITESEQMRISRGELLHDGIGQHLTGIQLYGSSLAERLLEEQNPHTARAYQLQEKGRKTHNQIRRIARMLFPVKIGQVGLVPALHELASCFTELEQVEFSVKELGQLPELPEEIALQLYRICQESANHALYQLSARRINVEVFATKTMYSVKFGHDGLTNKAEDKNKTLQLIDYRLQNISGTAEPGFSLHGLENTIYAVTNPNTAAPA